MHEIPRDCYDRFLEPPTPIEYEVDGIVTLVFDDDNIGVVKLLLRYSVSYEREHVYADLLDHKSMLADMWSPLVAYVHAQMPHFDAAGLIDDVQIERVRETR